MPINPTIPLGFVPPQVDDPLTARTKQATLADLMGRQQLQQLQLGEAQRGVQEQQTMADLYRTLGNDPQALVQGMAQRGLGARIPAFQKQQADANKVATENDLSKFKLMKEKTDYMNAGMSALLSDPELNHEKVLGFVGSLVRNGAIPAEEGASIARSLPGDVPRLRQMLTEKALQGLDASKRLDMLIPKSDVRNLGGTDQQILTNPLTGQVTQGQSFTKTATPEAVLADARARAEGAANRGVQMRGQDIGRVPAGYRAKPDGSLEAIPGGPADLKAQAGPKMTEDQGKATGWLVQASNAWANMQDAMKADPGANKPGVGDAIGKVPGLGAVGRTFTGPERQKFNQAASSLSEALLRAATGAGVTKDEAAQKIAELVPQFGDDEATRAQKQASIPLYLESLKVGAGPGAGQAAKVMEQRQPAQGAPKAGAVEDGYVFMGGDPSDKTRWKKK
jgi:hypothetical protein